MSGDAQKGMRPQTSGERLKDRVGYHTAAFAHTRARSAKLESACIRKNHLSNTTCLTQVFFKRGE